MHPKMSLSAEVVKEIDLFEENVKKFRSGEMTADAFQRIRLQHGVYGQRQDNVQMIRIKIPLGIMTADQIECIADLAETIAHNNAHITTRQDIQIHYVKLENTPMLMRKLANVGLSTREACGNTVRNVTASPSAGVDPEELFDVTPYGYAFAMHMMRNPICQNMGRKFKVAFDGGGVMTALPMLHEIGLIARIRGTNGSEQRGFKVYVGGGLGSSPRVAKLMYDFLPVEELIPLGESIIRVFDRYGERKIRMKARLKFLVEKLGFEKFKQLVEGERKEIVLLPEWNEYLNHLDDWKEAPPKINGKDIPKATETADYLAWKKTNVWPQKQKGYSMVEVRLSTGDMVPKQMRPLAKALRRYNGGLLRMMVHQNFLVRWVRDQDLPAFYEELKTIDMVKKDAQTIYDVTACPGTDTCRLGIASSMGLARVIEKRLYAENGNIAAVAKDLRIKISGCPNSCGQHHIANIGFYGGAFPVEGHTIPAFMLVLGGNFGREMEVATLIGHIPSKNVPDAVVRLVKNYVEKRSAKESFNAYYARFGKEKVLALLDDLIKLPTYEENPDFYVDWESKDEFALQKGVIGECAGQMVEAVPPHVSDGDAPLQMAEALLSHGEYESASHKAYEAIVKAANGLLYHRLVQTFNDNETIHEFENHFVRTGLFPQWKNLSVSLQNLRKKKADEAISKEGLTLAKAILKDCHAKEPEIRAASPRQPVATQKPDHLFI